MEWQQKLSGSGQIILMADVPVTALLQIPQTRPRLNCIGALQAPHRLGFAVSEWLPSSRFFSCEFH